MKACIQIACMLVLVACGKAQYEGFESYVTSFEKEARARGRHVAVSTNIQFVDTQEVSGKCTIGPLNIRDITVLRQQWEILSDVKRELLLFHELGHCELGRKHWADSIMAEPPLQSHDFEKHRGELLDELFG